MMPKNGFWPIPIYKKKGENLKITIPVDIAKNENDFCGKKSRFFPEGLTLLEKDKTDKHAVGQPKIVINAPFAIIKAGYN